jgi:hypothetical protein
MAITAITPAQSSSDEEVSGLEDITHGCVQCGTTLTRTVRTPAEGDREPALQA